MSFKPLNFFSKRHNAAVGDHKLKTKFVSNELSYSPDQPQYSAAKSRYSTLKTPLADMKVSHISSNNAPINHGAKTHQNSVNISNRVGS